MEVGDAQMCKVPECQSFSDNRCGKDMMDDRKGVSVPKGS